MPPPRPPPERNPDPSLPPPLPPLSSLPTYHLVTVVLLCQQFHGWFDDPAPQPQHEVQSRLLLYVIVAECSAIFQLLPGEDESLLVRRDALLVLDLRLHVLDGVTGFHLGGGRKGRRSQNSEEPVSQVSGCHRKAATYFLAYIGISSSNSIALTQPGELDSCPNTVL